MRLFDLHCDTLTKRAELLDNSCHVSLKRGLKYAKWAQVFAIWIDDKDSETAPQIYESVLTFAEEQFTKYAEHIKLIKTAADMDAAFDKNKCAALISIENACALGGSLENIKKAYDRGVRIITLTWNAENRIGGGVDSDFGLTEYGLDFIRETEKQKITVDVSHLNERGFYDAAENTARPFIATHSNAFSVCGHKRNLRDEQFKIICERGGLAGINLYPLFLNGGESAVFEDAYRHISHFLDLGGEKSIAVGADFDGADMAGDMTGIESMAGLYDYLLSRNLPESTAGGIFFDNAYNFFMKNL